MERPSEYVEGGLTSPKRLSEEQIVQAFAQVRENIHLLHDAEHPYALEVAWENLMDFICSLDIAEVEDNAEFDDRLNVLFDYITEHCQDIPVSVRRLPKRIIDGMQKGELKAFDQEVLRLSQSFEESQYNCEDYELFASYLDKMDLKRLGFYMCELESSALIEIVNSGALKGLEVLSLNSNSVDYEGLSALANSPDIDKVADLTLAHNNLADDDVAAIAQSKHLVSLEYLNLSGSSFTSQTFEELCQSETFQNLTELRLQVTSLNDEMVQSLIDSTFAQTLEILDIGGTSNIRGGGVRLILDGLGSLTDLSLIGVDIDDAMMELIAKSSPATSLKSVYVEQDCENIDGLCRWANKKGVSIYLEGNNEPENNPNW